MNQIYQNSCENMHDLDDNSVALTVTSPPYWNAIDYDVHASDNNKYYRTRKYAEGYTEYVEYLDWLDNIMSGEVLRVTKPGGFCAMVIGTVLLNGAHFPVPFDVTSRLTRNGWDFHQDIIWHKCTAGVKRAGVTIQKPFPGYYYPNIMTEYILVFRKPGEKIFKDRSDQEKGEAEFPINKLFTMDTANNIWHIAPVPPKYLDHPCPFPEEIPYRLITLYTYPGELVLDPFVGSGQTTKIANHLDRQYVGYDILEKYVKLSVDRLNEPLQIRPEQLVARFDKVGIDEPSGSSKGSNNKYRRKKTQKDIDRSLPLFDELLTD